ncbi:hypothetical protein SDC9_142659 [bioreactor metagenome]|uniref:Uncharacterized protein n=1 Tax=bioreactor metagenome TaxID=1076179 RepID=A0A645E1V2_9ZZZZ
MAVFDARKVERVHRLAVFKHDVVRDVDDVIDRPNARRAQALLHPLRRRFDFDIGHHARGVARAERAVQNVDRRVGFDVAFAPDDLIRRFAQGVARCGGGFARHAEYALAVRAVRQYIELEHRFVKAEKLLNRHADLRLALQNQNAVDFRAGYAHIFEL